MRHDHARCPEPWPRYSLQFFGANGAAAHRVYLLDADRVLAWSRLVRCFSAPCGAGSGGAA